MNRVGSRLPRGRVEVDRLLHDRAEAVVPILGAEPPFELSDEDNVELDDRLAELDRGEGVAAEEVFDRLRPKG